MAKAKTSSRARAEAVARYPNPDPRERFFEGDTSAHMPMFPEPEKRGRGRPARGEGSSTTNVVVGGARHGVRLADSERRDIERAARGEKVPVSRLLRALALCFARDPQVAAQVRGSTHWGR
jgi:hypothetical protein